MPSKTPNKIATGGIEQKPKQSDILLASATPIPNEYLPTYFDTIEWQHQIPACGSHAGNYLAEIFQYVQSGTFTRLSPKYLWKQIKLIDGFPPSAGTDMGSIMKILRQKGVCEASLMPNDTLSPLNDYTAPTGLTAPVNANAEQYRIETYAFKWNPSFDELKRAIYENKAVIMLLRIDKSFWTPSWKAKDILPLRHTYAISSGHFVVAYAYDESYVYFYNSFGDTWGNKGIGYFGEDYMPRCVQIGTAIDLNKILLTQTLKIGSKGSEVSILQKKLGTIVDGKFGKLTKQAVIEYQKAHGLVADGIVGEKTRGELNK